MEALEFLQNNLHVLLVVAIFCMVQSVFGMGLLIFGTPTLIILDVPFLDCLIHLIPASLAISFLQIAPQKQLMESNFNKAIPILMLSVMVGLMVHLLPVGSIRLDGLIGIVMLCYGVARMFSRVGALASAFVSERYLTMLVMMGLLHGVSNMGGALLAILSSARYSDKNDLRDFVALNYAVLAGTQLCILLFVMESKHFGSLLVSSLIAVLVYTFAGKRMFTSIGGLTFQNLFTGFIFVYSGALLLKYFQPG